MNGQTTLARGQPSADSDTATARDPEFIERDHGITQPEPPPGEPRAPSSVDLSDAITAALAAVERRPVAREAQAREPGQRDENGRSSELLAEQAEERRQNAMLRTDLAQALADVAQTRKRFQKLDQELEEVRKRLQRAEMDLPMLGGRNLLACLLPALDDLDAVLEHLGTHENLTAHGQESIEMLRQRWHKALQAAQVQTFDAVGQQFDPTVHEVIAQVDETDQPAGTVVRQAGRGYLLAGKMLRSARVVVSKG